MGNPKAYPALMLLIFLGVAVIATPTRAGESRDVITGPGFIAHQEDPTFQLEFRPPPQHAEVRKLAVTSGIFRAYKLPSPNGRTRSLFTVAFQAKSDMPGLRNLSEFVRVDLNNFKREFPKGLITQVKVQGRIQKKFRELRFPFDIFMFKGNKVAGSSQGDSLVLFFTTPGGFWSVVWTIPQQFIQQGFPVFFEPFIEGMTAKAKTKPK